MLLQLFYFVVKAIIPCGELIIRYPSIDAQIQQFVFPAQHILNSHFTFCDSFFYFVVAADCRINLNELMDDLGPVNEELF